MTCMGSGEADLRQHNYANVGVLLSPHVRNGVH